MVSFTLVFPTRHFNATWMLHGTVKPDSHCQPPSLPPCVPAKVPLTTAGHLLVPHTPATVVSILVFLMYLLTATILPCECFRVTRNDYMSRQYD